MKSMMITNLTKKTVLAKESKLCKTPFQKARGLMFSKPRNLVFIFHPKQQVSLHMFFVFFPIDIVCLSSNQKVIELKEDFKPLALYKTRRPCTYLIELPAGTIRASRTRIGDTIHFPFS